MKLFIHKRLLYFILPCLGFFFALWFNKSYISNKTLVVHQLASLDSMDCSNLMHAATLGHKTQVEALLKQGLSVDTKDQEGNTALVYAVANGHKELVTYLIQNGAE